MFRLFHGLWKVFLSPTVTSCLTLFCGLLLCSPSRCVSLTQVAHVVPLAVLCLHFDFFEVVFTFAILSGVQRLLFQILLVWILLIVLLVIVFVIGLIIFSHMCTVARRLEGSTVLGFLWDKLLLSSTWTVGVLGTRAPPLNASPALLFMDMGTAKPKNLFKLR